MLPSGRNGQPSSRRWPTTTERERLPPRRGGVILILGFVILALVFDDRTDIRRNWSLPARFYSRNPIEGMDARPPSQPGNVLAGLVVGLGAVIYGLVSLLT